MNEKRQKADGKNVGDKMFFSVASSGPELIELPEFNSLL